MYGMGRAIQPRVCTVRGALGPGGSEDRGIPDSIQIPERMSIVFPGFRPFPLNLRRRPCSMRGVTPQSGGSSMRLRRPRHGTIAAYLALFVALGGTSYAAASLPRNSVGTAQIQNQAVTGAKVRNGSLTAGDFR